MFESFTTWIYPHCMYVMQIEMRKEMTDFIFFLYIYFMNIKQFFSIDSMCLVAQSCLTLCNPIDRSPGENNSNPLQYSCLENGGVGCHALLQGIFPTQGSNPGPLHCGQILYFLSHQGSPLTVWGFRKSEDIWVHSSTKGISQYWLTFLNRPAYLLGAQLSMSVSCIS